MEKKVSELEPSAENLPKVQAQLDAALISQQEIESKAQIMEEQLLTKVGEAEEKKELLEQKMKERDAELKSQIAELAEKKEKLEEDMLNMRVNKDKEIIQLREQVKHRTLNSKYSVSWMSSNLKIFCSVQIKLGSL